MCVCVCVCVVLWLASLKETSHLEDLGVCGSLISKCILKEMLGDVAQINLAVEKDLGRTFMSLMFSILKYYNI